MEWMKSFFFFLLRKSIFDTKIKKYRPFLNTKIEKNIEIAAASTSARLNCTPPPLPLLPYMHSIYTVYTLYTPPTGHRPLPGGTIRGQFLGGRKKYISKNQKKCFSVLYRCRIGFYNDLDTFFIGFFLVNFSLFSFFFFGGGVPGGGGRGRGRGNPPGVQKMEKNIKNVNFFHGLGPF